MDEVKKESAERLVQGLKTPEVVLVKATEGVMSADPKIIPEAKPLSRLDIHEMFALSYGGAKVIKAEVDGPRPAGTLRLSRFTLAGLIIALSVTDKQHIQSAQFPRERGVGPPLPLPLVQTD